MQKKILILIPWFHPAYKAGGPIQSIANMVDELATESGISFKIICSNKDHDAAMIDVTPDEWVNYNANTKVWYSSDNNITALIKKEISGGGPCLLFINGLYDWDYNFKPLLNFRTVKKIISPRGMLHPQALAQKSVKKKIYISLLKFFGLHKKNFFHATNAREKKYVHQIFGDDKGVAVAANFPRSISYQKPQPKQANSLKLASIALISPMKNHVKVLGALLKIDAACTIEYDIYGPVKDAAYWQQCQNLIKEMPANVSVKYHGNVKPAEITWALMQTHVFILPSQSENYGHAIYEALLAGRPVITSNNTPWNGLQQSQAGVNADDVAAITNAIVFFALMEPELYYRHCNAARQYAVDAVDVQAIKKAYIKMFETADGTE